WAFFLRGRIGYIIFPPCCLRRPEIISPDGKYQYCAWFMPAGSYRLFYSLHGISKTVRMYAKTGDLNGLSVQLEDAQQGHETDHAFHGSAAFMISKYSLYESHIR